MSRYFIHPKNDLTSIYQNRLTLPAIDQVEVFGYKQSPMLRSVQVNGVDAQLSMQESSYRLVN